MLGTDGFEDVQGNRRFVRGIFQSACRPGFARRASAILRPSFRAWADFILMARMVGKMQMENFYVPVGVILPELDGVFAADVDVHATACVVGFGVIGKLLRVIADGDKTVPQNPLLAAGEAFRETQ
jgi:hypothetical protein